MMHTPEEKRAKKVDLGSLPPIGGTRVPKRVVSSPRVGSLSLPACAGERNAALEEEEEEEGQKWQRYEK